MLQAVIYKFLPEEKWSLSLENGVASFWQKFWEGVLFVLCMLCIQLSGVKA